MEVVLDCDDPGHESLSDMDADDPESSPLRPTGGEIEITCVEVGSEQEGNGAGSPEGAAEQERESDAACVASTGCRRRVAVVLNDQGVATAVPLQSVVEAGLSQRVLFQEDGQPVILEVLDHGDAAPAQEESMAGGDATPARAAAVRVCRTGGASAGAAGDRTMRPWVSQRNQSDVHAGEKRKMKTGMWSRDEVDMLSANINQYCKERGISNPEDVIFRCSKNERKNFYWTVGRGINRPLFAIYRRIIRMYDRKNHVGRYTEEEVEQLRNLRAVHGNKWGTIGALMGRSAASVKDRVRVLRDNCNHGKWLKEEEERLVQAVCDVTAREPDQTVTTGINWAAVALKVQTRREKQCRAKWLNNLSWRTTGGQEWKREDDKHLIDTLSASEATDESALNWSSMAENWPRNSVRSPQWLRSRWWQLKKHLLKHRRHHLSFKDLVREVALLQGEYDSLPLEFVDAEEPLPPAQLPQPPPAAQPHLVAEPAIEPHHFLPVGTRLFVDHEGHVLSSGAVAVQPEVPLQQETTFILEPQQLALSNYTGAVMIGGQLYTAAAAAAAPLQLPLVTAADPLLLQPAPAPHATDVQLHGAGVALTAEAEYHVELMEQPLQEAHLDTSHALDSSHTLDANHALDAKYNHASVITGDPIMSHTAPGATSEDEGIDCHQ